MPSLDELDILPFGLDKDVQRRLKRQRIRNIKRVIVHCSDSGDVSAAKIDGWHRKRKSPFACIGYHYVIRRDGRIEEGRPLERVGAHCKGKNTHSVGVCLAGTMDVRKAWGEPVGFSSDQFDRLGDLVKALCRKVQEAGSVGPLAVYGHRDFNRRKSCPGFAVQTLPVLMARANGTLVFKSTYEDWTNDKAERFRVRGEPFALHAFPERFGVES